MDIQASGAYGDKSGWSGEVFVDNVIVGNAPPVKLAFAVIEDQTNNFFTMQNCNGDPQINNQQGWSPID